MPRGRRSKRSWKRLTPTMMCGKFIRGSRGRFLWRSNFPPCSMCPFPRLAGEGEDGGEWLTACPLPNPPPQAEEGKLFSRPWGNLIHCAVTTAARCFDDEHI